MSLMDALSVQGSYNGPMGDFNFSGNRSGSGSGGGKTGSFGMLDRMPSINDFTAQVPIDPYAGTASAMGGPYGPNANRAMMSPNAASNMMAQAMPSLLQGQQQMAMQKMMMDQKANLFRELMGSFNLSGKGGGAPAPGSNLPDFDSFEKGVTNPMLDNLKPRQDAARTALNDQFRMAGGGSAFSSGAYADAAAKLESELMREQNALAAQTRMGAMSPYVGARGQDLDYASNVMGNQSALMRALLGLAGGVL
jgi:hypothetical protein